MNLNHVVMAVDNISKTYPHAQHKVYALKNVSFQLYQGELLAIMGTSGSGKSTLLNILGALDKPDAGKISLQGNTLTNVFSEPYASQYRSDYIGFVFQAYHLLKDLTVEENIVLPLILKGATKKELMEKASQMMELVGLTAWRSHRPIQLSGGQQQRVAIARALITSPPIILADEPTGNLDYNTSLEIMSLLVEMKRTLNQSIVLVTHDPMIAAYSDRALFFHDGEVIDEYTCTNQIMSNMDVIMEKSRKMMGLKR